MRSNLRTSWVSFLKGLPARPLHLILKLRENHTDMWSDPGVCVAGLGHLIAWPSCKNGEHTQKAKETSQSAHPSQQKTQSTLSKDGNKDRLNYISGHVLQEASRSMGPLVRARTANSLRISQLWSNRANNLSKQSRSLTPSEHSSPHLGLKGSIIRLSLSEDADVWQ